MTMRQHAFKNYMVEKRKSLNEADMDTKLLMYVEKIQDGDVEHIDEETKFRKLIGSEQTCKDSSKMSMAPNSVESKNFIKNKFLINRGIVLDQKRISKSTALAQTAHKSSLLTKSSMAANKTARAGFGVAEP
jgi:hypothetical protein